MNMGLDWASTSHDVDNDFFQQDGQPSFLQNQDTTASFTSAYASYPAVSSSVKASLLPPSPSTSQQWRLNAPSSSQTGITFSPSLDSIDTIPRIYRAPRTVSRSPTQSLHRKRLLDASFTASQPTKLLENTLKLTSLGVSDSLPNPTLAPKVTISSRCRPDSKVVFDQEPFLHQRLPRRPPAGVEQNFEASTRTSGTARDAIQSQLQSRAPSTTGTTTLSSPNSSTEPLPAVATPASSLVAETEKDNFAAPTSPLLARRAAWSKPRSWADLASRMGPPPAVGASSVFSENVEGAASSHQSPTLSSNASPQLRKLASDRSRSTKSSLNGRGKVLSLASVIAQAETQFSAPLTYPRGMINKGNMCFANAILQTLVYCAPFYNLFRLLGEVVPHDFHNSTPLMEAVIQFLYEFHIISDDVQRDFIHSPPTAVDALRELQAASEPFAPEALYDAMKLTKRFDAMRRGHQEDAEEFLGFFLDTLHEELQVTLRKAEARASQSSNGKAHTSDDGAIKDTKEARHGGSYDDDAMPEEVEREVNRPNSPTEGDGWLEVGQKGRTSFTRTMLTAHSPITRIFGGKLRSVLRTPGSKDSVTLEPYQPLQLDIQPAFVTTIEEALDNLTKPETISGVLSSSKKLVDATKQVFIEILPPVLVVHLKRFYYDDIGGVQKSSKVLGYGPTLEVPESVVSPARRAEAHRRYKLFGIVYHHGRYASGGHYTVDVLRQDRSEWLHIDDTTWRATATPLAKAGSAMTNGTGPAASVVSTAASAPGSPKQMSGQLASSSLSDANNGGSAYLLFYAREDAIEADAVNSSQRRGGGGAATSAKTNGSTATSKSSNDALLPPISVRQMAETAAKAAANVGPAVPGAPLGARKAESTSAKKVGSPMATNSTQTQQRRPKV